MSTFIFWESNMLLLHPNNIWSIVMFGFCIVNSTYSVWMLVHFYCGILLCFICHTSSSKKLEGRQLTFFWWDYSAVSHQGGVKLLFLALGLSIYNCCLVSVLYWLFIALPSENVSESFAIILQVVSSNNIYIYPVDVIKVFIITFYFKLFNKLNRQTLYMKVKKQQHYCFYIIFSLNLLRWIL